jgi:DNA mismatch repair protein MutS
MALVKEYFDLTAKYVSEYGEKTILLMQVGSFFEVYGKFFREKGEYTGSRIFDFSKICELNITEKNVCTGAEPVFMAGFKDVALDKYVKKIQEASYTAVVYAQDEQAKNTTRSLVGIFSPGTYFSLDVEQITNNTSCIWVDYVENKIGACKGKFVVVGFSNIDIYTGKTSVFQFKEGYVDSPTTYDELEKFISIYKPNEVIFISNLPESEMENIIKYANIQAKMIHMIPLLTSNKSANALRCEKQVYQKELVERFYKNIDSSVFMQPFFENHVACQAFCYLLDFIYQHNPHLVYKISEPAFENYSDRLILANHSLKQLNMIDDNNYQGKYSSVLKMLNMCLTAMGKRQFANQLLNPTMNEAFLKQEYNITEYLLNQGSKYDSIATKLSDLRDISKWTRQIYMKKITPKFIYQIYQNLLSISQIYTTIINDDTIMDYLQRDTGEKNIHSFCTQIMELINNTIHLDLSKDVDQLQNFDTNFIQKGIDDELDTKNRTLMESHDKLEAVRSYFNQLIGTYEKKTKTTEFVKVHETEKNHFTLLSTKRRCTLLKTNLSKQASVVSLNYVSSYDGIQKTFDLDISPDIVTFNVQSASNNSITTQFINELCKNITVLKLQLKDIVSRVYSSFINKLDTQRERIDSINYFITHLDVIYAKACLAKKYNYCKPEIVDCDKSFVQAQCLRHCLIENLQKNEIYVANDITLGKDHSDGILLYGTNAVGKTSFIRALGIAVIMAQAGLYVPCTSFFFKPYKYIFTRILGNDNIFEGLSTFAVEMSELRTILKLADKHSLVLGDELCSGTESISAISIFVAGIQKLHYRECSFIFATHIHEIIHYEEITSLQNVLLKHMSVIYDRENDLLVYDRKMKDGPGTNMYGLEVCKSLALPEDFLSAAMEIRCKYYPETGSVLSLNPSHFNARKIMGMCEKCGTNMGGEVHHLQHQSTANESGIIQVSGNSPFHKNHPANLLTLCEKCHDAIHRTKTQHKKVKTSKGIKIRAIEITT